MSPEEFMDWLEQQFGVGEARVYKYSKHYTEKIAAVVSDEGYITVQVPGGVTNDGIIFVSKGVAFKPGVSTVSFIQLWWKFGYNYPFEYDRHLKAYARAIIDLVNGSLQNLEPEKIKSILAGAHKGVYRTTIAKFMKKYL